MHEEGMLHCFSWNVLLPEVLHPATRAEICSTRVVTELMHELQVLNPVPTGDRILVLIRDMKRSRKDEAALFRPSYAVRARSIFAALDSTLLTLCTTLPRFLEPQLWHDLQDLSGFAGCYLN